MLGGDCTCPSSKVWWVVRGDGPPERPGGTGWGPGLDPLTPCSGIEGSMSDRGARIATGMVGWIRKISAGGVGA